MKNLPLSLSLAFSLMELSIFAQGTLLFDQQSSTDETLPALRSGPVIQIAEPGQSFTPMFSSVDFFRLKVGDWGPGDNNGATLWINLRTDSITGDILASTEPVSLPDGFLGVAQFEFSSPVPLTAGETYFFEPTVSAGSDYWNVFVSELNYPGGISYGVGRPLPGGDMWFREGLTAVPEPSTVCLGLVGLFLLAARHRKRRASP